MNIFEVAVAYVDAVFKEMLAVHTNARHALAMKREAARQTTMEACFLLISILLLIGIYRYQVIDETTWIRQSLLMASLLFFPIAIGREIHRSLRGTRTPIGRMLLLWGIFFLPVSLATAGILALANGALDHGVATCHDQQVIMKGGGGSRSGPQATVESWRSGRTDEVIQIAPSLARALKPGNNQLRVCTRPGRLGFEWITALSVVETAHVSD